MHKLKRDSKHKLLVYYKNGLKKLYYSIDWHSKNGEMMPEYGIQRLKKLVADKHSKREINYACISPNRLKASAFTHFMPITGEWISDKHFNKIQTAKKNAMARALIVWNHFGVLDRKQAGYLKTERSYLSSLDILPIVDGHHPANALFNLYGKYLDLKDKIQLMHIYMNGFDDKIAYITQKGDLLITEKSVRDTCSEYFSELTPEIYDSL